ncbi:hypothetical protein [Cupriavidus nantongensis]|uniref:hypothetical protein n=1 Tax=Cupriavidus nantongensis TaxID=1796606 RepID=UPI0012373CFF|nr:hypothetical protein [Cupriavidus nantongensis]
MAQVYGLEAAPCEPLEVERVLPPRGADERREVEVSLPDPVMAHLEEGRSDLQEVRRSEHPDGAHAVLRMRGDPPDAGDAATGSQDGLSDHRVVHRLPDDVQRMLAWTGQDELIAVRSAELLSQGVGMRESRRYEFHCDAKRLA